MQPMCRGLEFLEDKQWNWDPTASGNLIWWAGLNTGSDEAMVDQLRFTQDLIRLRWNQPALRGDNVNPFHVHDQNRVIAFHRWLEGTGNDVNCGCNAGRGYLVQLRDWVSVCWTVGRSFQ